MNHEQLNNRTNSLPNYIQYLLDLTTIKFEQTTKGEATMAEYNQLMLIIKDLLEVLNSEK
jgi:ABC-type uncharacterized transport system YnjBCD substrate-binding protein